MIELLAAACKLHERGKSIFGRSCDSQGRFVVAARYIEADSSVGFRIISSAFHTRQLAHSILGFVIVRN
jgi:hypothetical protein